MKAAYVACLLTTRDESWCTVYNSEGL